MENLEREAVRICEFGSIKKEASFSTQIQFSLKVMIKIYIHFERAHTSEICFTTNYKEAVEFACKHLELRGFLSTLDVKLHELGIQTVEVDGRGKRLSES